MYVRDYAGTRAIIVGGLLIFTGLLSVCLGIPSATIVNGNYPFGHLGYGIWGGILYIITGAVGIITGLKKTPNWIIWFTILCLASLLMGLLQFALGITSACMDYQIQQIGWMNSTGDTDKMNDVMTYLKQFQPMTYFMVNSKKLREFIAPGTIAVDSLLAFAGILTAFAATMSMASGFRVCCCPNINKDMEDERMIGAQSHMVTGVHQKQGNPVVVLHENTGFQSNQG